LKLIAYVRSLGAAKSATPVVESQQSKLQSSGAPPPASGKKQ